MKTTNPSGINKCYNRNGDIFHKGMIERMQGQSGYSGIFITIEGTDGSGKSTVASLLKKYYTKHFPDVLLTREPGGIVISEKIREIILNPDYKQMDAKTEALLYAAARRQHLMEKIIPALQKGKLVICDRFIDSSLSYQGIGRGLGIEAIWQINTFAIETCMPACTLLLEVDYKIALQRIMSNPMREVNRLDMEAEQFHKKVSEGYRILKERFPKRIQAVDATKPIEQVVSACVQIIDSYI